MCWTSYQLKKTQSFIKDNHPCLVCVVPHEIPIKVSRHDIFLHGELFTVIICSTLYHGQQKHGPGCTAWLSDPLCCAWPSLSHSHCQRQCESWIHRQRQKKIYSARKPHLHLPNCCMLCNVCLVHENTCLSLKIKNIRLPFLQQFLLILQFFAS